MENKNDFEYKYVALSIEERKEIESIKNSYLPKDKSLNKLDYLKKLDNKVKSIPTMLSLIVGIVGLLLFGLGLAMILEWHLTAFGVIVSAIGLIPISLAYLTYQKSLKYLKDKYSQEILEISNDLLEN